MRPSPRLAFAIAAIFVAIASPVAAQESIEHSLPPPPFLNRMQPFEAVQAANAGMQLEVDRSAAEQLTDHRALDEVLEGIAPQRPGTVDAYVLVVALDSDAVFAREARQAANVLERRYDAAGRTIMLAGPDGQAIGGLPRPTARGTPASLSIALAHIAATMDTDEDVLVLFTTSHGTPNGLYYHYGDQGFGGLSPSRLRGIFDELGIENRLVIVNACFSGIFVSGLSSPDSAIVSAASAGLTSFGCSPGNDWTFFGDAFVNRALRQPQALGAAFEQARGLVAEWEDEQGLPASQPKFSIGRGAIDWLSALESRMPDTATPPVGRSPAEEN